MRKFATTLAASLVVLGAMALVANAEGLQNGASAIHGLAKNATPIVKAACFGFGAHCPPGRRWVCGPGRCWCAPC